MAVSLLSADKSLAQVLEDEFRARSGRNTRYSLRSFSRHLGISASRLSQILRGKQGLSEQRASSLADRLGYNKEQNEIFTLLARRQFNRDRRLRTLAESRLERYREHLKKRVDIETFKLVCDWYHLAILELISLPAFKNNPKWIANRLGIKIELAETAIDRLIKSGLLVVEHGKWKASCDFSTTQNVPSEALREFHHQIMDRAQHTLENSKFEERDYSEVMFAVDRKHLDFAKKRLREFRRTFMKELEEMQGSKDSLYVLSMQFFRLDHDEIQDE